MLASSLKHSTGKGLWCANAIIERHVHLMNVWKIMPDVTPECKTQRPRNAVAADEQPYCRPGLTSGVIAAIFLIMTFVT
jgi:hypothetical protein